MTLEQIVNIRPNKIEMRVPYRMRAKTSPPFASVPSQFFAEGGEGKGCVVAN
ncbi:hypothetical protein SEEN2572_11637 [Salmonella enterica subsp. enterica serovar Newport str. VA_R100512572]|nr:hypothetical protein SEEN2572_11637 [Salmonella enterica subsp. enterica serovar Newport str. VA_R100512572]